MYLRFLPVLTLLAAILASPARAAAPKPTLVIHSSPNGATVRIDGEEQGSTPETVKTLSAGSHTVQVIHPGFHPFSQKVTLKRGQKTQVNARLKRATLLPDDERAKRKQALGHHSAGLFVWQKVGPSSLVGGLGGGVFLRARAAALAGGLQQDPVTGYYFTVDDPGDGTLSTTFYLDAEGTLQAGLVSLDYFAGTIDWSFTAGDLEGFSGDMELSETGETGSGTLPGGGTWATAFSIDVNLHDQSFAITGSVDLTDADNHTDHWSIHWTLDLTGSADGGPGFHLVTDDGYTVDFHVAPDGSGGGTLKKTSTGAVLATFTFTSDGTMTVVYSDGTTETLSLTDFLP